jgi:hypothetical protein
MTVPLQTDAAIDWDGTQTPDGTPAGLTVALTDTLAYIRRFVVLSSYQATASALFVAHTHAFQAFDTTPYMHVTSATKRAGKTRYLEVLEPIVAKPWLTGRTSTAALVRKVDVDQPTMLFDESDATFKGEKEFAEAFRGILNTGYKRSGKCSLCIGKGADLSVRDFATFSPKVLAGIGALPDTVADRAIPIVLRRRMASEPVERWRERDGRALATPIHRQLATWARSAIEILRSARPALPTELSDRAQDVWEPLLAIADLAGGDWPVRARRAAVALMGTVEDADPTVELLTDLVEILASTTDTIIPTKDILEQLVARDDRPWPTWRHGKPITARGLARLLGPLGIHPDRHLRTVRGYRADAFTDAIARYLPIEPSQCHNLNNDGPKSRDRCDLEATGKTASVTLFEADSIGSVTQGHIDRGDDSGGDDDAEDHF